MKPRRMTTFPPHCGAVLITLVLFLSLNLTYGQSGDSQARKGLLQGIPEFCLNDFETTECFRNCQDDPQLITCYNSTRSNASALEKTIRWGSCSSQGINTTIFRCLDVCQADPKWFNCQLNCDKIVEPSTVFFDTCDATDSLCQQKFWEQDCRNLYANLVPTYYTEQEFLNANKEKIESCTSNSKEAYEQSQEIFADNSSDSRKQLLDREVYLDLRLSKITKECQLDCKKTLLTTSVDDQLEHCIEQCSLKSTRSICKAMCPKKKGFRECVNRRCSYRTQVYNDCKDKNGSYYKFNTIDCPTKKSCSRDNPLCKLGCEYATKTKICEELICPRFKKHDKEQYYLCLRGCQIRGNVSIVIYLCQITPLKGNLSLVWNPKFLTPKECLDTSCPLNSTGLADCIEKNCKKAKTAQFCIKNPRRSDIVAYCLNQLPSYFLENLTLYHKHIDKIYIRTSNCEKTFIDEYIDNDIDTEKMCRDNRDSYSSICNTQCMTGLFKDPIADADVGCRTVELPQVSQLTNFANCHWDIDFSNTNSPFKISSHYFNERNYYDVQDQLVHPNTSRFLEETSSKDSKGYFVFPYFIVIRGNCVSGARSTAFEEMISRGAYPDLSLRYSTPNNRALLVGNIKVKFRTGLVELEPIDNDPIVPRKANNDTNKCHKNLCYPAFVGPLVFLHTPIFDVTVAADDTFEQLSARVHVSSFHSRNVGGSGKLHLAYEEFPAHPHMFFPHLRLTQHEDQGLALLHDCITESSYRVSKTGYCPPLDYPYNAKNKSKYFPLSTEDLFSPQYTFNSAPVVAIAGFYKPNLAIIADPDMNKITLFEWAPDYKDEQTNNTVFRRRRKDNPCVDNSVKVGDFLKPIYSTYDESDAAFPINYYRVGYDSLNYANGSESRAIFDAIALEDRLLLVTTGGLVTLYGSTHDTVISNSLMSSNNNEKIQECFKFVRVPRTTSMGDDIIVGITYEQRIYVGKLEKHSKPIEWDIIGRDAEENTAQNDVENICNKVISDKMGGGIRPNKTDKWCEALDATSVPTVANTIKVLIRMGIQHENLTKAVGYGRNPDLLYFYIVAAYKYNQGIGDSKSWNIISILPRIPCTVQHVESVRSLIVFDHNYFASREGHAGCTTKFGNFEQDDNDYLYLTSITHTRMHSNHMYLYGDKIIHSSDGGETFVLMHNFPHSEDTADERRRHLHRIIVLAFDSRGHLAFLTNKRELWYGSTGVATLTRLRPSGGYQVTQTIVSKVPGFSDAIPFTLMFDSQNHLFELVAVENDGKITHIMKRDVRISEIFQNIFFQSLMQTEIINQRTSHDKKAANPNVTSDASKPFEYDEGKWSLFCPFNAPIINREFAENKPDQVFFLNPPFQHPNFGISYSNKSLYAFQAGSFCAIYSSLFESAYNPYSAVGMDPIALWGKNKRTEARIGFLNLMLGDSGEYGIVVNPDKNIRDFNDDTSTPLVRHIYLDYNQVITYSIEFSIKDDASLVKTDYINQNIAQIQMNVDNSNGTLLQINTEKVPKPTQASVKFDIIMSLIVTDDLPQSKPGESIYRIPVILHLIGAFGRCFEEATEPIDDSISLLIMAGCQHNTVLRFNWNATLYSIKFRNKDAHFGVTDSSASRYECFKDELVCFYARQAMTLHFDIFNIPSQTYTPFTGKYTLKVIAGGYSKNEMKTYSSEAQEAYNTPGVSDVSLIWTEWDETFGSKFKSDTSNSEDNGTVTSSREVILQSGVSAIKWACHTLSPCARIAPTLYGETIYWFKIRISNKDVDNGTVCLYERDFDILLYGTPPSPEIQLMITIVFCLLILTVLYVFYYCGRSHKKVWRANKLKIYGWFQIVIDTFPKPLKDATATSNTQEQALRKAYIMGSIQGHLQVPHLDEKGKKPSDTKGSYQAEKQDTVSILSTRSDNSSVILPAVNPRTGAGTWTDLVYEQIITKRLQAIVEKNKQMREGILKKVDLTHIKDSMEQEERFQSERGTKASNEKGYQPPVAKKRQTTEYPS